MSAVWRIIRIYRMELLIIGVIRLVAGKNQAQRYIESKTWPT